MKTTVEPHELLAIVADAKKAARVEVLSAFERWWADAGPHAHLSFEELLERLRDKP